MDNYRVNVNINKLRNEVLAREDRKIKIFEKVLELCYQKIITTNKTSDECCCIFICPQVIFGLPLYNLLDCINYIMTKLIQKGFNAHLALPNHIFISWKIEQPSLQYPNTQNKLLLTSGENYNKSQDKPLKLFTNKSQPLKHYKSINEYTTGINTTYDINDIELFRTKIDDLLTQ